ncbi:MAG: c-type cytochrome [Armatimonadota bacterium]
MGRTPLNYAIVALLAIAFLGLAFTGAQMGFVIPLDIHALWGVSHRWWASVHLALALAFALAVVLHFVVHWDWLAIVSRRSRLRSVRGWSAVVLAAASTSVFVGLRSAPRRERVSQACVLGRRVYLAQECDLCHSIGKVGGTVGPALDHVGSKRTPDWMREEIVDPQGHNPDSVMPGHQLSKRQLDALVDYLASLK